jgi:hypothetical protein
MISSCVWGEAACSASVHRQSAAGPMVPARGPSLRLTFRLGGVPVIDRLTVGLPKEIPE